MKEEPLYAQIQSYIADKINSNEWPEHHQIPSERELGERFDVSRITAKNAVLGLVNEGLLYRHRGKGTFVAKRAVAVLPGRENDKDKSKKIIGFLFHWMELHYGALLFAGLETELTAQGYHVVYKRVAAASDESRAIRELLDIPVSGLVVLASPEEHFNEDIIRLLLDKFPLVLVEKTMRDMRANSVYCDTEKAGALMAEYLLARGIDEIGLLTYPESFTYGVKERILGFRAGLRDNGGKALTETTMLTITPHDLDYAGQMQIKEEVVQEIEQFLRQNKELRALAVVDALLARYAGIACARLGLDEMAIVCCDEPSGYRGELMPAAYIDQSPMELGRTAARLLLDGLNGRAEPQTVALVPRLVETGPR